jgi:hypothetical protein
LLERYQKSEASTEEREIEHVSEIAHE